MKKIIITYDGSAFELQKYIDDTIETLQAAYKKEI